ncbi:MAG TPA: SRPBCC family protein [Candidatus Udaeobacter sp.]
MHIHQFSSEIWLARPIKEVFAFFSDATNLDSITPPWLSFRTVTRQPIEMHLGTVIDYRLRVRGFPVHWRSEITEWEPPYHFVDEQIRGPYRLWIHAHRFQTRNGGTLVCDDVRYAVPFDWLLHKFIVRPDVERIFAYRADCLRRQFGNV